MAMASGSGNRTILSSLDHRPSSLLDCSIDRVAQELSRAWLLDALISPRNDATGAALNPMENFEKNLDAYAATTRKKCETLAKKNALALKNETEAIIQERLKAKNNIVNTLLSQVGNYQYELACKRCLVRKFDVAYGCGHVCCQECDVRNPIRSCHFCGAKIVQVIKLKLIE